MKTYKRETAIVMVIYLGYIGLFGRIEALEALVWPFMLFVGGAFGMDWAKKQTDLLTKNKGYNKDELNSK